MSNFPQYKTVSVAELVPYARNSRTHSQQQVDKIAASIREFGFLNPVIIDGENGIVAGHGRVLAAQKLGMATLPIIEAAHLTEAQKRAYVIADNRLALDAGWDNDLLKIELADLDEAGFDLSLTGFEIDEIESMLAPEPEPGLTDPDATPEPPADPVTCLGDVWILGKHRLVCGDSTDRSAIDALMQNERADLMFTSPPYAQQRDYGKAKESVADWDALMQGVFSVMPVKDGAQVLVNLGLVHRDGEWHPYWDAWIEWMREAGWRRFGWYVWDQGPGLPGDWNGRLAPSHEFIFHFNRQSRKANKTKDSKWAGHKNHGSGLRSKDGSVKGYTHAGRDVQAKKIADSVFRVVRHKARGIEVAHPAVFPVSLVEEVFAAYSKAGDVVYEPFCGSGTQIIAAEKVGVHCFGSEIDPAYVDVAIKRWQDFTGKAAVLEDEGRTFDEVKGDRDGGAKAA